MDYTLLTAAHLRKNNPSKMDARREQEYYENAEQSSLRLESMLETAVFPATLAKHLLETARLAVSQFRAFALYFSYGWKVR
jgi:hypothetical protein